MRITHYNIIIIKMWDQRIEVKFFTFTDAYFKLFCPEAVFLDVAMGGVTPKRESKRQLFMSTYF